MKWQKRLVLAQLLGTGIGAFTVFVTRRLRKRANDRNYVRHTALHPWVTHLRDSHRHGTIRIAIRDERYEAIQLAIMMAMQVTATAAIMAKRPKTGALLLTGLAALVSGLTLMLHREYAAKHEEYTAENNKKAGIRVLREVPEGTIDLDDERHNRRSSAA